MFDHIRDAVFIVVLSVLLIVTWDHYWTKFLAYF